VMPRCWARPPAPTASGLNPRILPSSAYLPRNSGFACCITKLSMHLYRSANGRNHCAP